MADYSTKGHYYIGEPRFELKQLLPLLPPSAQVLDMGAGKGNNTRLMLHEGHMVTAVEPNPAAIASLRQLQREYPHRLTIVEASLDSYAPKQKFDAVVCCMVAHFMQDRQSGIKAIRDIQSWTKPGGYNLLTGYLDGQPLPPEYSYLLKPGELSGLYHDWTIHWQQESYRLTMRRIFSLKDIPRLLLGRRGFKAARIIAQK